MLNPRRYKNSICRNNYLHNYVKVADTPRGFVERCKRCGKQIHVPYDMPNDAYISHHIRQFIQPNEPLYKHEYKS